MRIPLVVQALLALVCLGSSPAVAQAGTQFLERADGSRIAYQVRRDAALDPQDVVLILQGSGCTPVGTDTAYLERAAIVAPGHAVVSIENYGVADGSAPDSVEGCPAAFWAHNTLQQRVMDAAQVIARLRREAWWAGGRIVLFGGSEGGAVAAMLAPLVPETRAVIVFSSGIGVPVGDLVRSAIPPEAAAAAVRIFAEARANPTGLRRWGGFSYRFWADALDVTPARMLLQTDAPILLIHGTRDQFAPVATARATRDLLVSHGRSNLTYREYEGYDHFMTDAEGVNHRSRVLGDAAAWLFGIH